MRYLVNSYWTYLGINYDIDRELITFVSWGWVDDLGTDDSDSLTVVDVIVASSSPDPT